MHCNSTYPTPYKDVNLSYLARLKQLTGALIGYSGHERGIAIPVAAVALGARIIEKHFTVDRGMEGNDHKVSLLPEEFAEMVRQIRAVEEAMGQGGTRELTQGELMNRENLAKSLVITCDLAPGAVIQRDMIAVKSPGQGLQPNRLDELVGQRAQRAFTAGDLFFESDLSPQSAKKSAYRFSRPYGIPARYHDYQTLTEGMELRPASPPWCSTLAAGHRTAFYRWRRGPPSTSGSPKHWRRSISPRSNWRSRPCHPSPGILAARATIICSSMPRRSPPSAPKPAIRSAWMSPTR